MNLPHLPQRLCWAFFNTYQTPFTVIVVCIGKAVFVYQDTAIRASGNAGHTPGAGIVVPDRSKYPPVACPSQRCIAGAFYGWTGYPCRFEGHADNRAIFINSLNGL
jgi:hypothetical protein